MTHLRPSTVIVAPMLWISLLGAAELSTYRGTQFGTTLEIAGKQAGVMPSRLPTEPRPGLLSRFHITPTIAKSHRYSLDGKTRNRVLADRTATLVPTEWQMENGSARSATALKLTMSRHARSFLGIRYVRVSRHSRHIQKGMVFSGQ